MGFVYILPGVSIWVYKWGFKNTIGHIFILYSLYKIFDFLMFKWTVNSCNSGIVLLIFFVCVPMPAW